MTTINASHSTPWSRAQRNAGTLLALLLTIAGLLFWASATDAADNALTDIDYTALSGNRVRLTLTLQQPVEPTAFTIDNPARLALDLPGTRNTLSDRSTRIGAGVVESVSSAEAGGRTRVVVRLSQMVDYQVNQDGNQIHVVLEAPRGQVAEGTPPGAVRNEGVRDIDFRRGDDDAGRVIVTLDDPTIPVDIRQEGDRLQINLLRTRIPQRLERRLDVRDFATPVDTIEARQRGDHVRLSIATNQDFRHIAYQTGRNLTVEITPIEQEERDARPSEREYEGDRLSLNFQDIEVRAVLQLIADFTGLNVVVSDDVSGTITLRLQDVPWDQALDIILTSQGLDYRQHGNVLMIGPAEEIAARERRQLEAERQIEELEPIRSEFLQINYANAANLAQLIRSGDDSLLSSRGRISIDERTNTLIVRDTQRNLTEIRNLIATLDVPVRQVLIESRIVIANDDFTRELGVRFGYGRTGEVGGDYVGSIGGTGNNNINLGTGAFGVPGGLIVDLPSANPAAQFGVAVGRVGTELLQLELSAMEMENRGDVVSSPRVITANKQAATIEQGVEIPYEQATSSGATSVEFQKAVLGLTVVPQITPDDRVMLDLQVSKDSVGQITTAGPAIDTQSVTTQVLVDNGETVVLGGIYERTNRNGVTRVPFFGDLPLVGALFRSTERVDERSELLVFVTPRILEDSLTRSQTR